MKQFTITVQTPAGQQQLTFPGNDADTPLADLLRRSSFPLNTRCGGKGLCDGCLVHLVEGNLRHRTTGDLPSSQVVRACDYRVASHHATLLIPARSLLAYEPQVVSTFKVNISRSHDPIWQVIPLNCSDTAGTSAAAALSTRLDEPVAVPADLAQRIAEVQRQGTARVVVECTEAGWAATGMLEHDLASPLGLAIDIGTTTVAVLVVDLSNGKVVASASGFNRQMHLGDDVLTRINLCTTDKRMLERLQSAIVKDTIERLILKAMKESGVTDERIACINIAANTTMLHLFAGVDPSPMGFAPFNAPFLQHRMVPASAVQLRLSSPATAPANGNGIAADPAIHLLPSASAYVGADITAGVVSSGLAYDDGPSLLVDVGTNGEIVVRHGNHMWGTATAAGPAFEGSRMACGMRAGQGAISRIRLSRTPNGCLNTEVEVIGNVKPTGICGSAYVDFLAQARQVGLLSPTGRLMAEVAPDRVGQYRTYGTCFTVAYGHGKEPIVIGEGDIASLMQAKAAIAAGILTLLRRTGQSPDHIRRLYLAGGFGMHLNIANTIACGLLPGFREEQIQLVGNTSLAGAYLSLLDCSVLSEIKRIAHSIEIVELNLESDFEDCYVDQLCLP